MKEPQWVSDMRAEVEERYLDADCLDIYDTMLTLGMARELLSYLHSLRLERKP